jgi:hypothetical protein
MRAGQKGSQHCKMKKVQKSQQFGGQQKSMELRMVGHWQISSKFFPYQ